MLAIKLTCFLILAQTDSHSSSEEWESVMKEAWVSKQPSDNQEDKGLM